MPADHLELFALPGLPSIQPGDDLVTHILEGIQRAHLTLHEGDILVISSKIVSKAENRYVDLRTITPTAEAIQLSETTRKDPRLVEVVLRESVRVSRAAPNVLIVKHRLGFTSANAGIDQSNTGRESGEIVLLLPENPDQSAARLADEIERRTGIRPPTIISDTHGRPFRIGNLNVAIGASGLPVLYDQRGEMDLYGRELQATITAIADEIAAAAGLVTGQADEGQPVVLMRGLMLPDEPPGQAADIIRPPEQDLYT
ncbi:MAG: coenzyme F420-0:L-glutamate ligase [Chloroflexi bacterium]|nr:coenzyme F420-0:L-glutamate ligase [Chloroflexota bacterium]